MKPPHPLTRRSLHRISLAMALAMTGLAWALFEGLHKKSPAGMFRSDHGVTSQAILGLTLGLLAAVVATGIESLLPGMDGLRRLTRHIWRQVQPTVFDLAVLSAAAGWSEELLFRGALQPIIGIWAAAALFAFAHGALTRLTWGRAAFTAFLFCAGILLGLLCDRIGLVAAMVAHGAYDFAVLLILRRQILAEDASLRPS